MRLSKIKLVGFKSFVDSTALNLKDDLVAIVGPNGCGKSNIIDAVRWVMGESSAKYLRGEGMDDVIFNGSTSRKPIGKAYVELIFDNTKKRIGGEYASYDEISVKRQVTREGKSTYYLNQTRCRRKDITDIFLGTGLGARSYAVIEQGMISKFIDAKPEEMRNFLEEAAGISFYKKRRHETELRMQHTQENLVRLEDLGQEQNNQLERLQKQAAAAEQFQKIDSEKHQYQLELLLVKWQSLDEEIKKQNNIIDKLSIELEEKRSKKTNFLTNLEKLRKRYHEQQDDNRDIENQYHNLAQEIAKTEQQIQNQQEKQQQLNDDLSETKTALELNQQQLVIDEKNSVHINSALEELAPKLTTTEALLTTIKEQLLNDENNYEKHRDSWEDVQKNSLEFQKIAEIKKNNIEQLESTCHHVRQRITRLQQEQAILDIDSLERTLAASDISYLQADKEYKLSQNQVEELETNIQGLLDEQQKITDNLQNIQTSWQTSKARLASLKALQDAALGKDQDKLQAWLLEHSLNELPRLTTQITVESKYTKALEIALGDILQSFCIAEDYILIDALPKLENSKVLFFNDSEDIATISKINNIDLPRFSDIVTGPSRLQNILEDIFICEELKDALVWKNKLQTHQMIVTYDGILISRNWIRVQKGDFTTAGVLARDKEIKELCCSENNQKQQIIELEKSLNEIRILLKNQQELIKSLRKSSKEQLQKLQEQQQQVTHSKTKLEQSQLRIVTISDNLKDEHILIDNSKDKIITERGELANLISEMSNQETIKEQLFNNKKTLEATLKATKDSLKNTESQYNNYILEKERFMIEKKNIVTNKERLVKQTINLEQRYNKLFSQLSNIDSPEDTLREKLLLLLEKKSGIEKQRQVHCDKLAEIDNILRDIEKSNKELEIDIESTRESISKEQLAMQSKIVKQEALEEQLQGIEIIDIKSSLDKLIIVRTVDELVAKIANLENQIKRLGAINMAAIEEYSRELTKKEYLDKQLVDLKEALSTLEGAISKIDQETKTRFKETFTKVNTEFNILFPKLFGGGKAYLQLLGDDLLSSGVALMAQPPGKKNSSINLLSGGEKALTTIALIFAIFRLNPAPFCILDEVDAPLDDANVGRFCNLVKYMSESVQFIFISHNKLAIEMAHSLVGVTMREAGVSRLVSVNIEAATEMLVS